MVNKHSEAMNYLRDIYVGLKEYHYLTAIEIGNIDYFNNHEPSIVNINHYPYLAKIGKTYHQQFIDLSGQYLSCVENSNKLLKSENKFADTK